MSIGPTEKQWFVLRDLKRRNANDLAYHELAKAGLDVFTPMMEMIINIRGHNQRREVPVIQDLLFVHESKQDLDPYVARMPNLQYRFSIGKSVNEPVTVREYDMQRFIKAVRNTNNPKYFMPGELKQSMYGKQVRIVGGILNGYEGCLLSVRGMRTRRLIIEIPNFLVAAVEVQPEFIQFL